MRISNLHQFQPAGYLDRVKRPYDPQLWPFPWDSGEHARPYMEFDRFSFTGPPSPTRQWLSGVESGRVWAPGSKRDWTSKVGWSTSKRVIVDYWPTSEVLAWMPLSFWPWTSPVNLTKKKIPNLCLESPFYGSRLPQNAPTNRWMLGDAMLASLGSIVLDRCASLSDRACGGSDLPNNLH
jgi:hypothetical protein